MRYIDFRVQTILLIFTGVLTVVLSRYGLLIGQLLLGAWQLVSSVISVVAVRELRKMKAVHLALAFTYLAIHYVSNQMFYMDGMKSLLLFFIPCWILAIFYYILTWRWQNAGSDRSKFLPNISF